MRGFLSRLESREWIKPNDSRFLGRRLNLIREVFADEKNYFRVSQVIQKLEVDVNTWVITFVALLPHGSLKGMPVETPGRMRATV